MDEIMGLRSAEKIKEPVANHAHALASADEVSGATTATVGNATDKGLTSSSSAAKDTPQKRRRGRDLVRQLVAAGDGGVARVRQLIAARCRGLTWA